MTYSLKVFYQRANKNLQRRIKRWATHSSVKADTEKEARLALIKDYNKRGLRIISIERQ